MPMAVEVSGVTAGYGDVIALDGVDLAVRAGELVAVVGPNGGGKSTLLKLIAGLLRPRSGVVRRMNEDPSKDRSGIAYVPQAELVDLAFPVSVWDVAMMGRYARNRYLRQPGRADREAVREGLDRVGMLGSANRQIGQLSGGQRRRAFLARAIAAKPDLYLLDEPVTGVDITTQEDVMRLLDEESQAGRTVIATTHDLAAAGRHFRRVVGINRRIEADGGPEILSDPQVLARIYAGHLVLVAGSSILLDDAHHHAAETVGERHFHSDQHH